jgi:hypothetical protein
LTAKSQKFDSQNLTDKNRQKNREKIAQKPVKEWAIFPLGRHKKSPGFFPGVFVLPSAFSVRICFLRCFQNDENGKQ